MRKHLKVIFFTIVLAFLIFPFVLVIPIQVFRNPMPNIWGPLVTIPFILGVSYATLRRHLFNVKAIVAEILIFTIWIFLLARIFFDATNQARLLDSTLFVFTVVVGIFLMRSVLSEVRQKEKLTDLNRQLDDLNQNLQQKVDEQTVEIRKSYEVEKRARLELVELDKAKDQFILTTQHHLRTPLTIVKGYLQSVLGQKHQTIDEATRTYLTKAETAANRIGDLINEFLDISQMEVGKSALKKQLTNIKNFLEDTVKELEPEVKKKNLFITLDVQNDTIINIDREKMQEVIANLIDNAVKYNKAQGTISIKGIKTNHPIERDKQIYKITIEDTGIGLTTEELSKVFTQYFERGKEAEKLYATGRGIGLAVTKNIIQAHGGRIYAESDGRDKGARFVVEMPIEP
ncbi:MAG: HAMP domain-containing histidine kinase [Candidatus Colwellbacteria bacterium]|nr:HAMP domain-containing histidine kinase [Candidatus Colwellbacteria bacterium]